MPAIVRVKRRIDEEPLSAFVLNGKKRRLDGIDDNNATATSTHSTDKDEVSTILKFAGTITAQDNDATTKYARLRKSDAKEQIKQKARKSNITERHRQEQRDASHEHRFRVVNCLRTTLYDDNVDASNEIGAETATAVGGTPKELTIVDIEKTATKLSATPTANATQCDTSATDDVAYGQQQQQQQPQQPVDSDTGYVYDLYLPENEQQAEYVDLMDDNYLRVHACDQLYMDDGYQDEVSSNESEDSNDENYYGNDYPDEDSADGACGGDSDDDEEAETRDLRRAVKKFVLDDDDDDEAVDGDDLKYSSSDDDYYNAVDVPFVHHVDGTTDDFVDDVDQYTVDHYGPAYAHYKARILREDKKKSSKDSDEDSSSDNLDYYD